MKSRILLVTVLAILIPLYASGCSAAAPTPAPTDIAVPVVSASEVTAEGRLEPVRYAQLALTTAGSISQLPVGEGEEVQAGEVIAVVQNAQAETLETAQGSAA